MHESSHSARQFSGLAGILGRGIQVAVAAVLLVSCVGCPQSPPVVRPEPRKPEPERRSLADLANQEDGSDSNDSEEGSSTAPVKETSLADLLLSDEDKALLQQNAPNIESLVFEAPNVDEQQTAAQGIRKLTGKYVTIYTDLPESPAVSELPDAFDAAVPLWCKYFDVEEDAVKGWHMTGYLVKDKAKHQAAGLFYGNLPEFLNGYQRGLEFWVYEQESDYYRRHLLLHEGVHGFMMYVLKGSGPPWYSEGMAEFLATHKWDGRKIEVGVMPDRKEDFPYWGRIKILQDEYAAGRGLMIREVMRYDRTAHLRIEPYAWSWAAVAFLDGHPLYRSKFRLLRTKVQDNTALFTRDFEESMTDGLRELDEQWQLFVVGADFGYDLRRNAVQYAVGAPIPEGGRSVAVTSDRGWQSTGLRMEAGKTYRVLAKGRFLVRQRPQKWWSEAGGITLEYVNKLPLGMLVGNIRLDEPLPGTSNLAVPIPIGLNRRIVAAGNGTLYLKINDHPGALGDNSGQLTVKVVEEDPNSDTPQNPEAPLTTSI
ncbi:MAG: LecA/PA-IL family lectin [Planctomycetota bacterium]